jgi:large subunit ribosomal protein L17
MRHGKTDNHLGRTNTHRAAMLSNMASSLILHKRIETTVAKARELRKYVEPLLTKSKTDSTHSRRMVFSHLQNKEVVKELFDNISERIANRPGGYTRIIKLGARKGDNAELCMIELVDYNELLLTEAKPEKRTRRSRRPATAGAEASTAASATMAAAAIAPAMEAEIVDTDALLIAEPDTAYIVEPMVEAHAENPEIGTTAMVESETLVETSLAADTEIYIEPTEESRTTPETSDSETNPPTEASNTEADPEK